MNQTITLEQLRSMPAGQIAALSPEELANLQERAVSALEHAKLTKELLDGVLNHKYADQANLLRQQAGKNFGSIHFDDGEVTVTADLPKRPTWNQKQLSNIVQRIQDAGDNPAEYVDITFKVAERRYNAWPEHIRHTFEPARTVKAGKPVFKLVCKKAEVA